MPPRRQLPWARKDDRNTTSTRRTTVKRTVPSDVDDDFFDGTILENPQRIQRQAVSDDKFPDSPSRHGRNSRRSRESSVGGRMPSSSPPPITADLPPPTTEYMLTGIDKFDLRDDEWMMVEDELLQTAKLFTQHLHLAEYETLKAKMEEQRKIATPRAVVAGTKPSAEGHFQNKAQEQAKKQKQAMRKILVSQDESSEDDGPLPSSPLVPPRINLSREDPPLTGKSIRPLREPSGVSARNTNASSDSDDLDAARRSIKIEPTLPNKAAVPPSPSVLEARHHSFKKPEIPTQTRKTVRSQRRNLWDEWDTVDLKSPSTTSKSSHSVSLQLDKSPTKISRSTTAQKSLSPTKPASTSTAHASSAPTRHFRNNTLDSADVSASTRKSLTYRTPDRSGKRKADEQQDSKKKPKFDDIPTFLF